MYVETKYYEYFKLTVVSISCKLLYFVMFMFIGVFKLHTLQKACMDSLLKVHTKQGVLVLCEVVNCTLDEVCLHGVNCTLADRSVFAWCELHT